MRLSILRRIMEIEEGVIRRSRRSRRITPSEISIILHMIRNPNSIIVLLFIQNNSQFKNKAKACLPPSMLKGQCPDYAHARASSVFSSKDNRTVILTRQNFLPDHTADGNLLFIFSSNFLDFRRSLLSYIKIWPAVRRLIAILSLAGPLGDPKISFRSL